MDDQLVGREYAGQLTDADLDLLAGLVPGPRRAGGGAQLRGNPARLPDLLAGPSAFTAVFAAGGPAAAQASMASPFLIFAVAVHRAAAELGGMRHVPERSGPRQRIPLFDAHYLRDFLSSADRRLFLAELLTSFTRVAGGGWYRSGPGGRPRPRRVSELDLVRQAGLLEAAPAAEQPGRCRRLGDCALFLAGIFPDYAITHAPGPAGTARLLRAARVPPALREQLTAAPPIDLVEHLGAQWYRTAWEISQVRTARLAVVPEVADRFRQARRVLNHIADRSVFPAGAGPWSAAPAS
ncbi:MAG: hypothetical protein ACLQDY_12085 [Streptosporangiaceae bacterium]